MHTPCCFVLPARLKPKPATRSAAHHLLSSTPSGTATSTAAGAASTEMPKAGPAWTRPQSRGPTDGMAVASVQSPYADWPRYMEVRGALAYQQVPRGALVQRCLALFVRVLCNLLCGLPLSLRAHCTFLRADASDQTRLAYAALHAAAVVSEHGASACC